MELNPDEFLLGQSEQGFSALHIITQKKKPCRVLIDTFVLGRTSSTEFK